MQFTVYWVTRRINSTSAYYKASTKTQTKHENSTKIQQQNTKKKKIWQDENNIRK